MKYHSRLPQCISDDFSPEEESNIKLRSVGKAQSNIRAYVSSPYDTFRVMASLA
jgi:hypothetical protein